MTYAGLTAADKHALLDAKARGAEWVARDEDEELVGFRRKPKRYIDMESTSDHWERTESENYFIAMPNDEPLQFIQWSDPDPVNIDLALAQIAEMESKPIDESATDDIVLAEVYSLREKLKIAADIIHKLDPNYDVTEFLHQVGSADYDQREEDLAPLTWNERINQMTVEEKAWYFVYYHEQSNYEENRLGEVIEVATIGYKTSLAPEQYFYDEADAIAATVKILRSPYTEGANQ